MNFIKLLPVIISLLFMAAHFYRAGLIPVVVIIMFAPFLLFVPHRLIARIIQALLAISSIEWLITISRLVSMRQEMGMPWIRLALILGVVAIITFGSIFVFRLKSLRIRYKLDSNKELHKDQT